jgi:hypothetical protein
VSIWSRSWLAANCCCSRHMPTMRGAQALKHVDSEAMKQAGGVVYTAEVMFMPCVTVFGHVPYSMHACMFHVAQAARAAAAG